MSLNSPLWHFFFYFSWEGLKRNSYGWLMVDYDLKKWFAYSGLRYDKLNDLSWILLLGPPLHYGETSLGNKFYCFSPRESPSEWTQR